MLAYLRTALGLAAAAVALIEILDRPGLVVVAWLLGAAGGATLLFGIRRFLSAKKLIDEGAARGAGSPEDSR